MIVIFVSDARPQPGSPPADADFKHEQEDHVKEARHSSLTSKRDSAGITQFCTFNFLCLNLTRRFCFSFSFYQTEYDNVTWELLDEKISVVPSAFLSSCRR